MEAELEPLERSDTTTPDTQPHTNTQLTKPDTQNHAHRTTPDTHNHTQPNSSPGKGATHTANTDPCPPRERVCGLQPRRTQLTLI